MKTEEEGDWKRGVNQVFSQRRARSIAVTSLTWRFRGNGGLDPQLTHENVPTVLPT